MLAQLLAAPPSLISLLMFTILWLMTTAFWLWMLVDCLTKRRLPDKAKLIWMLTLLLTYVVGALLYLVFVRGRRPARG